MKYQLFGIDIYQNPAGFCNTKNENELYKLLENTYFPNKFGDNWENTSNKELFYNGYKIDYKGVIQNNGIKIPFYYEVKNNEFNIDDLKQVVGYVDFLNHHHGKFCYYFRTIAMCYDEIRKDELINLRIIPLTIREIIEPYLGGR